MAFQIGRYVVDPPVVLAPMAGITNVAFRRLCREYASSGASGGSCAPSQPTSPSQPGAPGSGVPSHPSGGLFTCEMVTTRALLERHAKTMRMVSFAPDEHPRSLQLYGVDPAVVGLAVRMVVEEDLADHIDLNFGCPVPKVTRKGGGAALPWHSRLFERVVRAAVREATPGGIPVTVKMRMGIDADHLTYRLAGMLAQEAGAAAVTLHGRTLAQGYSGTADLAAIADLKSLLSIPVLGNGDIWEAEDAQRMMALTGVDGVVIGRGCLGRPWLFSDLTAAFAGSDRRLMPPLGDVGAIMLRHAAMLADWMGDEAHACADFRKHVPWYLRGFPVGGDLRRRLGTIASLAELGEICGLLDADEPFPTRHIGEPRGRISAQSRVILPEGWLDDPDCDAVPAGAESFASGG